MEKPGLVVLVHSPNANLLPRSIIAITGLDGHAYGSWRSKGNLGRMWLRHFLSQDLPYCRTMTYGYNSKLSTRGNDTIMDYSRGLMEALKRIRDTEEVSSVVTCCHKSTNMKLMIAPL